MSGIEQRNVVGAELVARVGAKSLQDLPYGAGRAETVGIGALAGDAHGPVLDQRARQPPYVRGALRPMVGSLVEHVPWVKQGQQRVDVQQIAVQSVSSSSALTTSGVTVPAPSRTGNRRVPFLTSAGCDGPRPRRINSEITTPIGFPRRRDSARAAFKTSSSRLRVVRTVQSIAHHAFCVKCGAPWVGPAVAFRLKRLDEAASNARSVQGLGDASDARSAAETGANERRWMGEGPRQRSAAQWAGVA